MIRPEEPLVERPDGGQYRTVDAESLRSQVHELIMVVQAARSLAEEGSRIRYLLRVADTRLRTVELQLR